MEQKRISLIECPRDAMQGWKTIIPTAEKVAYINSLLQVGFHTIDFGSFVSPKAIPQMADTKEVLAQLDLSNTSSKLLAIVANVRGAEEAASERAISYLGFPFSISPTFQQRNTNSTIEESMQRVDAIQDLCVKQNKELVIYLSMGFGNPYGDPYNDEILLQWADYMAQREVRIISLADTVGLATPEQIRFALETLIPKYPEINFGVHLHSTTANRKEKIDAAIEANCTRIDGALRGIGGCPMAGNDLVGNIDTAWMINYLHQKDLLPPVNFDALQRSLQLADSLFS
jgi:hydroxymethylglutaryl-CoA lyase